MPLPSSAEIAAQKNAEKIAALREKRLRDFTAGLEALPRLNVVKGEETTTEQYRRDCEADLARLMARASASAPPPPPPTSVEPE